MATIYKRGKIWYVIYNLDGKQHWKAIGRSKEIAELTLRDIEVKIAKNRAGLPIKEKLSEWYTEYVEYVEADLKPRAAERYLGILATFISFLSTNYKSVTYLSDITPDKVERFKLTRLRKVARRTVNNELAAIKRFFNLVLKRDYVTQNPVNRVELLKIAERKQPRFLTRDEIQKIFSELNHDRYRPMVEMLLYTGMRVGELTNLDWDDIDFEQEKINIIPKEEWSPKTGRERNIPLSQEIKRILGQLKKKPGSLFRTGEGNRINRNHLLEAFKRACKRAGIKDASLHTLRHTFASHLVMSGVDLYTVDQLLGHSDLKSTQIYTHLSQDHLRSAVEKLEF